MAGIFEQLMIRGRARKGIEVDLPRTCEDVGILDRRFVADRIGVNQREPLDDVQRLGMEDAVPGRQ